MVIKIIPNEKNMRCVAIDADRTLMIERSKESTVYNKIFLPFSRVQFYIYDNRKKVQEKILTDMEKYEVAGMHFCEKERHDVYFFHIEYTKYPLVTMVLYSYDLNERVLHEAYRFERNIHVFEKKSRLELFVLNDNYLIFQESSLKEDVLKQVKEYMEFSSFLYDRKNHMKYPISDERIANGGIMQMITVAPNVCAVRFGYSMAENNLYPYFGKADAAEEVIGLVEVSQMIADIMLNLPVISMEIIDDVIYDKSFLPIRKCGKYVVFSRITKDTEEEEIFFYQYITKETTMLLNKNGKGTLIPCVLNNTPYIIRERKKHLEFYNIKKNTTEVRIPAGTEIAEYLDHYILLHFTRKKWFSEKKESSYEIYEFPSMRLVHREKTDFMQCIENTAGNYLLFITDKNEI